MSCSVFKCTPSSPANGCTHPEYLGSRCVRLIKTPILTDYLTILQQPGTYRLINRKPYLVARTRHYCYYFGESSCINLSGTNAAAYVIALLMTDNSLKSFCNGKPKSNQLSYRLRQNMIHLKRVLFEEPVLDFEIDEGYGVQPNLVPPKFEPELSDSLPSTIVDESIYSIFKTNIDMLRISPRVPIPRGGKTKKLGVTSLENIARDIKYRTVDKYQAASMNDVVMEHTLPYVGCIPKIGSPLTNGKIRTIFPMSPGLQAFYETVFGKRHFQFNDATIVYGAKFPQLEYTYDVNSCDKNACPYWVKYIIEEIGIESLPLFFPKVVTRYGTKYPTQIPSGCYGLTQFIPMIFAYSVVRSITTRHFYIQGDGVMIDSPIRHSLLREDKPYTINGFNYAYSVPRFVNSRKKLESPRILDSRSFRGSKLWHFRREVYLRLLNAIDVPEPYDQKLSAKYSRYTVQELIHTATNTRACVNKLNYVGLVKSFDQRSNGWDAIDTQTCCTIGDALDARKYVNGF